MVTAKARQQDIVLDEMEAKDEEYIRLDEESAMVRQENEELHEKVEKWVKNLAELVSQIKSELYCKLSRKIWVIQN